MGESSAIFFFFQSVLARKKITLSMAGLTGRCESIEIIASVCSHSSSSACHSWAGLKRYKSSLGSNGSLRTFPFYVNCAHIGYVNDCSGCIFKTRFLHFVYSWKYSLLKMLFFFFFFLHTTAFNWYCSWKRAYVVSLWCSFLKTCFLESASSSCTIETKQDLDQCQESTYLAAR